MPNDNTHTLCVHEWRPVGASAFPPFRCQKCGVSPSDIATITSTSTSRTPAEPDGVWDGHRKTLMFDGSAEPKAGDWDVDAFINSEVKPYALPLSSEDDFLYYTDVVFVVREAVRRALSSAAPRITEKVLPCPDCHGTGTRGDYANAPNCETCDGGGVLYAPALSPTEVRSCGCVDVAIQEYGNQVELPTPMHVMLATGKGATVCIDACIASEIQALWRQGIRTTGCCCGHGTHSPYIGVVFEDIPRMKELGYKVAPNPSRPGDEDSFYPRSIHCTMSPAPLSGITEEMVEQVVSEFADPIKGSFDRTGYDDGAEYAALEIKDRLIALFRQQGAERKWISVDGQEIMPGTVLLVESWLNEWRVDVVKWGERTQWSKGDRRYSVLFESMPTPPPFTPTSHQVTSEATQAEG